jgi:putative tryptophan/tyrosine transport system substrate-binding protein
MRLLSELSRRVSAIALLLLLVSPTLAEASSVVILKTKNALMYVKVVAGAKKVLAANARVIEINIEGRSEDEVMAQIQAAAPRVILAVGLPAASLAKRAAPAPVVYSLVASPNSAGLSEAAGVSFAPAPKRYVELLQNALPQAKKLGVVFQPNNSREYINQLRVACERAKIQLLTRTASSDREIPKTVRDLVEHVDAFLVLPDAQLITTESYRFIVQATMDKRVPLITFSPELLSVGAMLALSPDLSDSGEKAGELVLQLLAGKASSTVGVAMPEGIVDYNEKSAQLLGRAIPTALMAKKGKRF